MKTILLPLEESATLPSVLKTALLAGQIFNSYIEGIYEQQGLTEVVVAPGRSYYDTNITNHHHFFCEDNGTLEDIPGDAIKLASLPEPPLGTKVKRFDVVVRVEKD